MSQQLFYRNVQAGGHLDAFLVSAAGSLLGIRFYLELAHFPVVGSGGLHIAHMLWGGLLMMIAIVLLVSFLGTRVQRVAAIIGGLGFGAFIDELGKFITSDNNYFFRPTIGLIYAIFVILYLAFNFLSRDYRHLSSREYQLNALVHLQEAILNDMDQMEKRRAEILLQHADQKNYITRALTSLLQQVRLVSGRNPSLLRRIMAKLDRRYQRFWRNVRSTWQVRLFFVVEAGMFLLAVVYAAWNRVADVTGVLRGGYSYSDVLLVAELASATVAAAFVVAGVVLMAQSRLRAFELFRRATLINIFLTEFFIFSREELRALPGFVLNLGVLLLITYVIHQEVRLRRKAKLPSGRYD